MTILFKKTSLLIFSLAFSLLLHIIFIYALRMFGTYDFTAPVNLLQWVALDPVKPIEKVPQTTKPVKPKVIQQEQSKEEEIKEEKKLEESPAEPANTHVTRRGRKVISPPRNIVPTNVKTLDKSDKAVTTANNLPPLSIFGNFLSTKNEKLNYLVSMLGLPVGNAELEAKNENGEVLFTLKVTTNASVSSIFPVDDTVETRHVDGRFILTKIKQQEGSFKSDQEFTLNLIRKTVSRFDNIGGGSLTGSIPTNEVLDTLSGFYLLRNRQLEIGKTETLHIYNSEAYTEVQVEILRRETVLLPNLTKVDTLVLQPLQNSAGICRRCGDILIWMTDDEYKVPVKIEASFALGKVSVELVSAESKPPEETVKGK